MLVGKRRCRRGRSADRSLYGDFPPCFFSLSGGLFEGGDVTSMMVMGVCCDDASAADTVGPGEPSSVRDTTVAVTVTVGDVLSHPEPKIVEQLSNDLPMRPRSLFIPSVNKKRTRKNKDGAVLIVTRKSRETDGGIGGASTTGRPM